MAGIKLTNRDRLMLSSLTRSEVKATALPSDFLRRMEVYGFLKSVPKPEGWFVRCTERGRAACKS